MFKKLTTEIILIVTSPNFKYGSFQMHDSIIIIMTTIVLKTVVGSIQPVRLMNLNSIKLLPTARPEQTDLALCHSATVFTQCHLVVLSHLPPTEDK